MSIQTELTRITNAKSAIKTAIEGKGVTVPDGTLLDGMAALIESIEAGGGATDVTDSVVSVAFSATNASNVLMGFKGIIPEDAKIAIFYFLGDMPNVSNNQCLLTTFPKVYLDDQMLYCRWKNSSYDLQVISSFQYDLVVNAGDTYRMVVIK